MKRTLFGTVAGRSIPRRELSPPEWRENNVDAWISVNSVRDRWDSDNQVFGVVAGISVYMSTAHVVQMEEIARMIDDGHLNTDNFRTRVTGYIWIFENGVGACLYRLVTAAGRGLEAGTDSSPDKRRR